MNSAAERTLIRDGEIRLERQGAILIITLNRPQQLNALTRWMLEELGRIFTEDAADPAVRAVLMTGAGNAFCSGADVAGLKVAADTPLEERPGMPDFTPRHCGLYKPTICVVNGMCAGAGLHFVSDFDIVIASTTAKFTDTHVNVGQVTAIEPIGLAQRMPLDRILRMIILGKHERLSAEQALEAHMVSEVLEPDQLMTRAMELAAQACTGSPAAIEASLRNFWSSYDQEMKEKIRRGYDILVRHRDHPDASEGPLAFMEKRQPVWSDGR